MLDGAGMGCAGRRSVMGGKGEGGKEKEEGGIDRSGD